MASRSKGSALGVEEGLLKGGPGNTHKNSLRNVMERKVQNAPVVGLKYVLSLHMRLTKSAVISLLRIIISGCPIYRARVPRFHNQAVLGAL